MRRNLLPAALAAGAAACGASADELTFKNDSLEDGGTAAVQAGFVNGEIGAATFEIPAEYFPLQVKRLQFFWSSFFGGAPDSLQEAILVWDKGLPDPGVPIFDADGPVLVDGFLNEFDIELFEVIVEEPSPITVGLQFSDAPNGNPFKPSLVTDVDGCQGGLNPLFAIPGGWKDLCSFGASGDFVIRVVVEPMGQPVCEADCDGNGLLNVLDFVCFQGEWQSQTEAGDCDGNGMYNILDFVCFQGAFVKGCP
jgi:hypothetical protein